MTIAINNQIEAPENEWYPRIALFLTALGLGLRVIGLGEHSYWFDEAREVLRALTPWPDVLWVSQGADPPLYRLILFPVASFTISEFWLRLPSALFSAATIYLAYYWLNGIGFPRLGLITAVLLTVAPVQVYYAQEVSQYSLVVFFAVLVLIVFERAGRYGRWNDWALLTLVSLGAIYTYYGLAWLFPILDIDLAWRIWKRRTRKRIVGFFGFHLILTLGLIALYVLLLGTHIERFTTRKNLVPRFIQPGLRAMLKTLDRELLIQFIRFFSIPFSPETPEFILVVLAALAILGSLILLRRGGDAGRRIIIHIAGTAGAMYIANGLGLYPFGDRYALAALPFFFVLIAAVVWGLWRWRPLAATLAGTPLVVGFIAFLPNMNIVPNPWKDLPREELRPVVGYIHQEALPGDIIYVYYGTQPAYNVYQPEPAYPTMYGTWFREWETANKIVELQHAADGHPRFWIVFSHYRLDEYDELLVGLANSEPAYQAVDEFVVMGAAAVLFERSP